ncbi:acyl-CoA dehydrogenase family protein [Sphingomonas solaris]|uniref:Acyl-CoA dehydrogenase n=1 Tax=Alterirhizorhabdus solaris TaxID=2529389 RepID=A0A558RBH5_9SPHN|nr:acyl-CoA dehydrogenase family protein [Sphingomonas solaris]TVV76734.1 acyl-CoA dehydrogenase [Sphingomonas solaris]
MDFAFTDDQAAITQAAREMLVETCTPTDLRRMLEAGEPSDQARWSTINEMGLLGILAPEAAGGLGLAAPDFVGIAEAAGYVALPEPLVDLAGVTIPLLASLDDDHGWTERAIGGAVVAIGHPANRFVADADTADALLLGDGEDLHIVSRNAVTLTRAESFDPLRRLFQVDWAPSDETRVGSGWGDAADRGALFAAAQMIGLAQRSIDMAVAYAKERTQFGKAIGGYQAVKHLIASAQVKVEFARPVVQAAAAELALGTLPSRARIAHAKIVAGEAADLAARTSVQVHGAMGMTWEVDLHFFLKRAMALNYAWGTPAAHRRTVIDRMTSLPTGPDKTFASELADA